MKKNGILFRVASGLLAAALTLAYRLRRLKQQFGRFRGSRFRRFRRNSPASDLLSFSLCRTDVHRDRERLL